MPRNISLVVGPVALLSAVTLLQAGAKNTSAAPPSRHDQTPRVVSAAVPTYPIVAIEAQITGRVRLRLTVRRGQVVGTTEIGSAPPILAAAAKENVRTWRFATGVNTIIETSFVFRISKRETEREENPQILLELPSFVTLTADRLKLEPVTLYGHPSGGV